MRGKTLVALAPTWWHHCRVLPVLFAAALTCACSGSGEGEDGADATSPPVQSEKSRDLQPVVEQVELAQRVAENNAFALDLFQTTQGEAVSSPYGLSLILEELHGGASGETRVELGAVLRSTLPASRLAPVSNALDLSLARNMAPYSDGGSPWQVSASWAQRRYGYRLSYFDGLAENFGAKPGYLDFAQDPPGTEAALDDWLATSDGAITDPLAMTSAAAEATRLAFVGRGGFRAAWERPFDANLTKADWFELLDGQLTLVPMMRLSGDLNHHQGDGYLAVELPTQGGSLSALVVLPDRGRFEEISAKLDPTFVDDILTALAPGPVDLFLPRFFLRSPSPVNLGGLGIIHGASREEADFSGIDGTRDLFVSELVSGAGLSVYEEGVGAAEEIALSLEDAHPTTWTDPGAPGNTGDSGLIIIVEPPGGPACTTAPVPVKRGRPFLVILRDSDTGAILSIGRILKPDPRSAVCKEDPSLPSPLPQPEPLRLRDQARLSAGAGRGFAVGGDGSVWTWGSGWESVRQMIGLRDIVAVAAGEEMTLALQSDGTIRDEFGEPATPAGWGGAGRVVALAAGGSHTVVLAEDGTVSSWARPWNPWPDTTTIPIANVVAVAANYYDGMALKRDGTVWAWKGDDEGQPLPSQVAGLSDVVGIAASNFFGLALRRDGTVWAWASDAPGRIGDGTGLAGSVPAPIEGLSDVVAVSAGGSHGLALRSNGTVWAWGKNESGQLGDGTDRDAATPVRVEGVSDVIAIAAGQAFSLALQRDGVLWTWGRNAEGQLGDGTTQDHWAPIRPVEYRLLAKSVAAGGSSSLAAGIDGTVWEMEGVSFYSAPEGGVPTKRKIDGLSQVDTVAAGSSHGLAVRADGSVWAWGNNDDGQLGDATVQSRPTPARVVGLPGVAAVAGGESHSLALGRDGAVWAWGKNHEGQLGDGTTEERHEPVRVVGLTDAVAISATGEHSLALTRDGTVWRWGRWASDDWNSPHATPEKVPYLGDVRAIAAGMSYGLALKGDGTVWAWGENDHGQLGYEPMTPEYQYRPVPARVRRLSDIVGISAGVASSLAIKADGTLWRWGTTVLTPEIVPGVRAPSSIAGNTLWLEEDGRVLTWGPGPLSRGPLGDYPFSRDGWPDITVVSVPGDDAVAFRLPP